MNIPEAIKLQEELVRLLPEVGFNKYIASTWLGIEALKRYKVIRANFGKLREDRLPGETEE